MEFAEQIKAQVNIVTTVAEYVPLRRMGARYVGLCPFHNEKTPSFNVNPGIGIYKCFGCGVGGDVIKFIQEIDNLTFWEALKTLAERNGIPVPQRRDAETDQRSAIYEMYEQAAVYYAQNLFGPAGTEARSYLDKRGLLHSTAQQFLLGYSEASWDGLLKRLGKRYGPAELENSGLFGKREEGGFYDKFRGRLMFPIHNESGKVIGFGGRALRAEDEPKYLNSPETAIYKKSSVLYNLHRAKETIRKSDRAVLVEGYMDAIGVYAAGVRNVVASCGTALTSNQVRIIKRYSQSVVVNFDPDTAGARGTERSIQMLLDEGIHMRVLELEAGLDPDEFIKRHGADNYAARLDRATNLFIWLADRARRKFGNATAEERMAGYEALLLPAIRRISDRLERAAVASEVAGYLGLDQALVLSEFRKMPRERTGSMPVSAPAATTIPVRERVLLRMLLENQECREFLLVRLPEYVICKSFVIWPIIAAMNSLKDENPSFSYELLASRLSENTLNLLSAAFFADHPAEALSVAQAERFLLQVEGEERELKLRDLEKQIRAAVQAGNMEEAMRLMRIADDLKRLVRASPA